MRALWLLSFCARLPQPWPAPFPSPSLSLPCYCHQRMTELLLFLKSSVHFRTAVKELLLFECEVFLIGSCVWTLDTQHAVLFGKLWNPSQAPRQGLQQAGWNCRAQSLSYFQRNSDAGIVKCLLRVPGVAGSVIGTLIMMMFPGGGRGLFFKYLLPLGWVLHSNFRRIVLQITIMRKISS